VLPHPTANCTNVDPSRRAGSITPAGTSLRRETLDGSLGKFPAVATNRSHMSKGPVTPPRTMTRKPRVVIIGAGGHAKVLLDALLEADRCDVVAVLDDDVAKHGQTLLGVPIVGSSTSLSEVAERFGVEEVALAIGDNYIRVKKFREVCAAGLRPASIIHPAARLSRFVELGHGVVILAGAVINPGTIIEDNVCVNTSASVDHDNRLLRSCHVFPNATLTGGVRVGEFSYIGAGAVIKPYRTVGKYSYVGAGAVVLRDVPEGTTVAGVPAREIGPQVKRPE